jgi:LytS/YehU family sensor histidine kinase
MRFGNKFNCAFNIDKTLDLKSVMVPALIIQPFIENAIWHGIMPKEDGGNVNVTVDKTDHTIQCMIDDTGIGREVSLKNKFVFESSHESKGVRLTQARLDLNNLLNERNAKVEIVDKKDVEGRTLGTTVIVSIKED